MSATSNGISVFLSYAEEDSDKANKLVRALAQHDIDIRYWQDSNRGSGRWIQWIEKGIETATAFVALLSYSYLSKYWCQQESEFALRIEQQLHNSGISDDFVLVVELEKDAHHKAGILGSKNALNLIDGDYGKIALLLARQIKGGNTPNEKIAEAKNMTQETKFAAWPRFQNRLQELDLLAQNITNLGGKHFWIILAGPQMGKTWLLKELPKRLESRATEWKGEARYLDLRTTENSNLYNNGAQLLLQLVGRSGDRVDEGILQEIARTISQSRRPWLLMVDGVEWLEDKAAQDFRGYLSKLHQMLAHLRTGFPPLAVIVAGRSRNRPWKGIFPRPEFSPMQLTHFTPDVVWEALQDMAQGDDMRFGDAWFGENASRLYQLSEGLPGMLVKYMAELRDWQYIAPEGLENEDSFNKLARPYVRDSLLCREALGLPPLTQNPSDKIQEQQEALTRAIAYLCTYRIFTASHVKQAIEQDKALASLLVDLRWSTDDLRTRLQRIHLTKDNDSTWHELDPAIRRLLFRHFHNNSELYETPHDAAVGFYNHKWAMQGGTEQVVVRIESFWHQSEVIRLGVTLDGTTKFIRFADEVLRREWHINGYDRAELFDDLVRRLHNDEELQGSLNRIDTDLFSKLIELVDKRVELIDKRDQEVTS